MQIIFNIIAITIIVILIIRLFSKSIPESFDEKWKRKLVVILAVAIIIKLTIASIWNLKIGHSLYIHDGIPKDSAIYHLVGQELARYFKQFIFYKLDLLKIYGKQLGYHYLVGIIYVIFGHYHIMVSIIGTLSSIVMAILMFHIAYHLFNEKIAYWTFVFNLFYPHYVSASYYILKDIWILFLITLFGWLTIKTKEKKGRLISYLWPLIIAAAVYFFRPPLALILIGAGGLHLILESSFKERKVVKAIFVLLICLTVIIGVGRLSLPYGRSSFEKIGDFQIGQEGYFGEPAPGYLEGARGPKEIIFRIITNPAAALKDFVRGTILIYWGPTYFYQRSGANLFYAYDNFVFWENLGGIMRIFLMPMVIFGFFYCLRKKKAETFLFYSFFIIWTSSMIIIVSRALRWILCLMPFTLMFGAIGVDNFNKIKPFYILYILFLNILIVANITLCDNLIVAKPLAILTSIGLTLAFVKNNHTLKYLFDWMIRNK